MIVRKSDSVSRHYRLTKTCSLWLKRRDQYQSDNRETKDKLNPLYKLSTMADIFHETEKHYFTFLK